MSSQDASQLVQRQRRAVILTALPVEHQAVRAHLTNHQEEVHKGTVYDCGEFSANGQLWKIGIAEIGAGNPGAARESERAIEHFSPNVILFVGVAGGLKDVHIGDVVASTKVYYYEAGKVTQDGYESRPAVGLPSHSLEQRARAEASKKRWRQRIRGGKPAQAPKVLVGPILSGEKVQSSSLDELWKLLRSIYSDALAVEMESYGMLTSVRANRGVEAISIRGISDTLDNKAEADKSGSQERASRHASAFAFELLAQFEGPADQPYRSDIERLRSYSRSTIEALSEHATIQVGGQEVPLHQPVIQALQKAVDAGSLLVVGEPGAGKSGALFHIGQELFNAGKDVVFFAADRLDAESLGALRSEIGLAHDLLEIFTHWTPRGRGIVIIDALDAARSDRGVATLRELIAGVMNLDSQWSVVASIRKYDLRYNQQFQQLFKGPPPSPFQEKEFERTRHFAVPLLSDEDLQQLPAQSLGQLVAQADKALHGLLRVPFNLRLMAELLDTGGNVAELAQLDTQIQLLDHYWEQRIIRSDRQGVAREVVLRLAVDAMVRQRSLRINRQVIDAAPSSEAIHDLYSTHILAEWQPASQIKPDRYIVTFTHHILFDYAVERLWLAHEFVSFVGQIEADPELVLAIRPSLAFHFQDLWYRDPTRTSFWELVFQVVSSSILPEIGKLIGPAVAAQAAGTLEDFTRLFVALDGGEKTLQNLAEKALRHVLGALFVDADTFFADAQNRDVWCAALEQLSQSMQMSILNILRPLLTTLCDHPEHFSPQQLHDTGLAARRLLVFAMDQQPRNRWQIHYTLEAVCRTFASDPGASEALLRRFLDPSHLAAFGHEDLRILANEMHWFLRLAPGFIEDLYCLAFSYPESSTDRTLMAESRILAFSSTRQQDYQSALYQLAENYPAFLQEVPVHAIRALISVLESYVAQHHAPLNPDEREPFSFNGHEAYLLADSSCIWDSGYSPEAPIQMLVTFEAYLRTLASDGPRTAERQQILNILATKNYLAVLWKRVLSCGAAVPHTLGLEIRSLVWAEPILTCPDTTTAAGELLKAIFCLLPLAQREAVEKAILAIPTSWPEERHEQGEHLMGRLLGCLDPECLVTAQAKLVMTELTSEGSLPPNEPLFRITISGGWTHNESEPTDPEAARLQQIQGFVAAHHDTAPTSQEIEAILPELRTLWEMLSTAGGDKDASQQEPASWQHLVEACETITRYESLSCESEAGILIQTILLEAARHPVPGYHPDADASFAEHQAWGLPAPRIQAAGGLMWLATHSGCTSPTVLEAIQQLSNDEVPAVRYLIAQRLTCLYQTAPDLMWKLLEHYALQETNLGVLQGSFDQTFRGLADREPDRIASLIQALYDRSSSGVGAKEVRQGCVGILLRLYIRYEQPLARDLLFAMATNPAKYKAEHQTILPGLRAALTVGPISPIDPFQEGMRHRAWGLFGAILQSAQTARLQMNSHHLGEVPWLEEDIQKMQTLAELLDLGGRELYFASGAFDERAVTSRPATHLLSHEQKQRFLSEVNPLLVVLTERAFSSLAHHLLKTLESLASVEPIRVFRHIGHIVQAAQEDGYQYEPSAVDLLVRLVERYLAEFRGALREDEECRQLLIEALDIFVQAGWPRARRITYRLEEIFR